MFKEMLQNIVDFIKDAGTIVLSSLVGAAAGGFAWFIAVSFLSRWLSLRFANMLYESYMIFIVGGAIIGFIGGISFAWTELIEPDRKRKAWERGLYASDDNDSE